MLKERERSTDLKELFPGMKPQEESEALEEVRGEGGGGRLRFFKTGGENKGGARGADMVEGVEVVEVVEEEEEEEEDEEEKLEEGVTAAV